MANEGHRAPIVDEMETEHSVPKEITPAPASAELVWPPWRVHSDILDTITASKNTLVYTLIGGSVMVTLCFAMKSPSEMTTFHWHIVLSIIGHRKSQSIPPLTRSNGLAHLCRIIVDRYHYAELWNVFEYALISFWQLYKYQFLMPHAFFSLQNLSWATPLSFVHRRRAHWVLQLIGSTLALIGSIIMSARKSTNFNTLHGKLALAALIFTVLSFANGVSSLYATQLHRYISPRTSKISHTLVGVTAFVLSSACLICGYLKYSFIEWAAEPFAYAMIAITAITTFLVALPPTYTVCRQLFDVVKNKIF